MSVSFLHDDKHSSILAILEYAPLSISCFLTVDDFIVFAVDDCAGCAGYYVEMSGLTEQQQSEVLRLLGLALRIPAMTA